MIVDELRELINKPDVNQATGKDYDVRFIPGSDAGMEIDRRKKKKKEGEEDEKEEEDEKMTDGKMEGESVEGKKCCIIQS